jgi:menaquinone-dependent protoporphyrinogen oxidase
MKPKVLVTAATRHHATREIAEAIVTGLRQRGVNAEARPIEELTAHDALDEYAAVVLGSAVYMGRWLGEARRFVQVHTSALGKMPVWLFSSGPLGAPDHLIPAGEPADVKVLMRLSRAVAHRTFPGRLEMKQLHFAERTVARTIHAPEGDCRDWESIDRFAAEIAEQLLGVPSVECERRTAQAAGRGGLLVRATGYTGW